MAKTNIAEALAKRTGITTISSDPVDVAYDEMFGLETPTADALSAKSNFSDIVMIDIAQTVLYEGDPFKLYPADKLRELARSIAEIGLQQPIRVRPKDGKYEILAGRHRMLATKMNGETSIAAIVEDVDDDTAAMIVTDTNLKQRDRLLPSEKAFAYKLQMDAIKRQGARTDLQEEYSSTQIAWKSESACIIAENNDVSKDEVRRHIRLTFLVPVFLSLVDEGALPFMVGVDMSYLDAETQTTVYDFFFSGSIKYKLDLRTSSFLRDVYKIGDYPLTHEHLAALLKAREHKAEPKSFFINRTLLKAYESQIPDDKELERLFIEFLEGKFSV